MGVFMKKKWFLSIVSMLCVVFCALGLGACGDWDLTISDFISKDSQAEVENATEEEIKEVYAQYVAYVSGQGTEAMSYEEWLNSIRGQDGRGIVKVELLDGCLWITYSDAPNTPVNLGPVQNICNHQWSNWEVYHEPTCQKKGFRARECSVCGETEADMLATVNHSFIDYFPNGEATCEGDATQEATCEYGCGTTNTQTIVGSRLGHDYKITEEVEATCTEDGYILLTCQREDCDATKTQTLYAKGHTFGEDTICDVCGYEVPNHEHNYEESVVAPTCTQMGYTLYTCDCGYLYKADYVDQLAHLFGDGVVTKEATCFEEGVRTYTCSREGCQESYTRVIPAQHDWEESIITPKTCTTDGSVAMTCKDCGETKTEVIPASHNWNDGEEITAPSCTTTGLKGCVCQDCQAEDGFEIPALGHNFRNGECQRCGAKIPDVVTPDEDFLEYGMYFDLDDILSNYGPDYINKYGVLLDYNENATIKKVGVYLTQDGTMWRRCIACTGENISYATYVPFLSYNDDIKYTGLNSDWINIFRLSPNSDNIWCYSNYATIGVNLEDSKGNLLLSLYDIGQAGTQTRIFDNLNEMIAWLSEDSDCIEHDYSVFVDVYQEATCTTNRMDTYKCKNCTLTENIEIENSKVECTFINYVFDGNATCLEDGTETAFCKYGCGNHDTRISENSKGHQFTKLIGVYQEATCTTNRMDTYQCENCEETEDREISGTAGHVYATGWTYDKTYHWKVCTGTGCSSIFSHAEHNWDDGALSVGGDIMTYTCTTCAQTREENVGPRTTITEEEWLATMDMQNFAVDFSGSNVYVEEVYSTGSEIMVCEVYNGYSYPTYYYARRDGIWYLVRWDDYAGMHVGEVYDFFTMEAFTFSWMIFYDRYEYGSWYLLSYDETTKEYYFSDSYGPAYYLQSKRFAFEDGVLVRVSDSYSDSVWTVYNHGTTEIGVADFHVHSFTQKAEEDRFAYIPSTCVTPGEYYYSCTCGLTDYMSTFTGVTLKEHYYYDYNGLCMEETCTSKKISDCFAYRLSEDGTYYTLIGITGVTKIPTELYIPGEYKGLPVRIGAEVFKGGTMLNRIVIHEGVEEIEQGAFLSCHYIHSVYIHEGLKVIGKDAFRACYSLQSLTIPASVTTIGMGAFYGGAFGELIFPDNSQLVSIGDSAFSTCEQLLSISFGKNSKLKNIDAQAFIDCDLREVTIPASVEKIGGFAFVRCQKLKKVIFESNSTLQEIGDEAFSECCLLENFVIPASVTSMGYGVFRECDALVSVTFEANDKILEIPQRMFYQCYNLESFIIPDSVTSIGCSAFNGCSKLTTISIPDSITKIEWDAFTGCTSLQFTEYGNAKYLGNSNNPYRWLIMATNTDITSVNVHKGCKYIAENAFFNCANLISVSYDEGIQLADIGGSAFLRCTSIESVVIPEGITTIRGSMFSGCSRLQQVTIPTSLVDIESFAFYNCTSLTEIQLPNAMTSIAVYAFAKCSNLKEIKIPSSVTSIGEYAFESCTSLTEIVIPSSVTELSYYVFYGCTGLTSITFEDTSTWYYTENLEDWENKIGGTEVDVTSITDNVATFTDENRYGCYYKL